MKLLPNTRFIQSPNVSGVLSKPTLLVLHYTASGDSEDGDAKYFQRPAAKASAHLVIERDGSIVQCVPFDRVAWHAGASSWDGKTNCNSFSIGIEIDNWGLLEKRGNGKFYSHAGTEVPADQVFVGKNKLGNGMYWEAYPKVQLDAVENAIEQILKAYPSITEIVGHEDIAPRRKIDPGPALYRFIESMKSRFFYNRQEEKTFRRKVTASPHLNVRSSPNGKIIGTVLYNTDVDILYTEGVWARIVSPSGWIHKSYLK